MKGYILDLKKSENENEVKIAFVEDKETHVLREDFKKYFYLLPQGEAREKLSQHEEVEKVEEVDKKQGKALKITLKNWDSTQKVRDYIEEKELGEPREHQYPGVYRYLIDRNLYPLTYYQVEVKGEEVGKFIEVSELRNEVPALSRCAFDIELDTQGKPDSEVDPIIMISYKDEEDEEVFYWTKEKGTELETIENFLEKLEKKNKQVIEGYNSTNFDWPYLQQRAHINQVKLDLGIDGSSVKVNKRGFGSTAKIFGKLHLDAYKGVEFLTSIGALRLPKNTLEVVYEELCGKEKTDIDHLEIPIYWKEGGEKLEKLKKYNLEDSVAAYEISEQVLPLYQELTRLIGLPPYEITRQSTSNMVEWLLVRESFKFNRLVPRRPTNQEIRARRMNPIKGGYVKAPETGLHEDLVVCDFKSLYPTIVISKNIGPQTLCEDEGCKEEHHESPNGQRFHKNGESLVPQVVEKLVENRDKVKKEIKETKDPEKKKRLEYRSQALKIIANSTFGYLGYPRARWYSRPCAEAITSWGRQYIKETIKKAEEEGFNVIYGDTDGCFIKLKDNQSLQDLKKWLKEINRELPSAMNLEYEGYYPRGLFVSKKGGTAAKKKYALLRDDGKLEIKGFALVRRDWAPIAKKTQKEVIKKVLEEGKPAKAVELVENVVKKLRNKEVDTKDLVIHTTMKKNIDNYNSIGPHVKAAKKLEKEGYKVTAGTVIGYVIKEGNQSISQRAQPIQLVKNKDYDSNYYIDNQVIPATMRILKELGVKESDLKNSGKQSELGKWT